MKNRINAKFIMISALAVFVTGFCGMLLFYNILKTQIVDDLKTYAQMASVMDMDKFKEKMNHELWKDGLRITWIDSDGTVLYDNLEDESKMENHLDRTEIQQAMQTGEGHSMRRSATSSKHTFYYALKIEDGVIIRIAKESNSIYKLLIRMLVLIFFVGIIVFVLCTFLAHRLTRRLVEPIEKMAENMMLLDETDIYDEIKPFVQTIKQQHIDIMEHAQIRQEFSANVSHELKTPLTAISGYAELIASGMTSEADTKYFAGKIHSSAERLQYLINDVIELSELDDSDYMLETELLDLYELAKDCAATMDFSAENHKVSISAVGQHVQVNANKNLMYELFYNLCSNAIRYNKEGGTVVISTTMENGHPTLSVKDTGIGIPKEQQERIFERFYRVDKSHSRQTGGTGLGLAIVKHIVVQHNAQIQLKSEVGVGTEMKVIF